MKPHVAFSIHSPFVTVAGSGVSSLDSVHGEASQEDEIMFLVLIQVASAHTSEQLINLNRTKGLSSV